MKHIVFYLIAALPFFANAYEIPKLTLSASATISKPADELQLKIGVVTLGVTVQEALSENNERMSRIFEELSRVGLEKDDYETNQFSINPTYSPEPKDPPPFWQKSIIGYEVTNSILIHTPKLEIAGTLIDVANVAGANSITDIRFGLHDARQYWPEALSAAGRNAIKDAEAIAEATGVHVVRVLSISLNQAQVKSSHLNLASFARGSGAPIEPGNASIEANVSLVCEITN